ncbi:MAG: hypothetical protein K0S39_5170 [Paenibacillus sp.]|nr:hypothetical protein [Paenibacillus sp.]
MKLTERRSGKLKLKVNIRLRLVQRMFQFVRGIGLALILLLTLAAPAVHAESSNLREETVAFRSGDVSLEGTLIVPDTPNRHPAVVLVHGSNSSNREKYRAEAEMFAKAGIAAFIYDKRADGFSKSRSGGRSYSLLAEDVKAAVAALGARTDIDRNAIGLWGISEGAWTASLAASRDNSDAAFLITVGAVGVQPVQQQSWQLVNRLYDQGITSASMIRSVTRHSLQLAVSAGLFAEAQYDPAPVFERLKQPVLAVWGSNDRVGPAMESSRIVRESLKRGGNEHFTLQFFSNAGHLLRVTPDGVKQSDAFAAGYSEAMTSWVIQVTQGQAPGVSVIGAEPQQDHLSPAGVGLLAWYNSAWLQLGTAILLMVIFAWYLIGSMIRFLRKRGPQQEGIPVRRHLLASSVFGLAAVLGFIVYFGFLMSTGAKQLAPVLFDRTLVWLILQLFAWAAVVSSALLARTWWRSRSLVTGADRVRTLVLIVSSLVFIPWALYWQLLIP